MSQMETELVSLAATQRDLERRRDALEQMGTTYDTLRRNTADAERRVNDQVYLIEDRYGNVGLREADRVVQEVTDRFDAMRGCGAGSPASRTSWCGCM